MVANALSVLIAMWVGYGEPSDIALGSEIASGLIALLLISVMAIFAVGTVHLSRASKLQRPGWVRSPFNWKTDPLQALFMSSVVMLGLAIGSVLRCALEPMHHLGLPMILGSIFVGLVLGQSVAYRIYRRRVD